MKSKGRKENLKRKKPKLFNSHFVTKLLKWKNDHLLGDKHKELGGGEED